MNRVCLKFRCAITLKLNYLIFIKETTDIILGYFGELSSDPVFVSHIITAVLNIKLKTGIILETGYQFLNQQIHSEDKTLRYIISNHYLSKDLLGLVG